MSEPRKVKLANGTEIDAVEIAPGCMVASIPPGHNLPIYGFVKMVATGDGSFIPKVQTWKERIRLGEGTLASLGLGDVEVRTIRCLAFAGFFTSYQLTPGTLLIDLESFLKHMEATKDPEFWTEHRRALFGQGPRRDPRQVTIFHNPYEFFHHHFPDHRRA